MNFEIRHILRWGIPGWFFLINMVISTLSVTGHNLLIENNLITHSVIITLAGVPLGYIIQQPYFLISNILFKDNTVEWNLHLLSRTKDEREFLNYRYGYMLTIVHGYGALISSTIISLFGVLSIVCINGTINNPIRWLLTVNSILLICFFINYLYSQRNVNRFVKKVLP